MWKRERETYSFVFSSKPRFAILGTTICIWFTANDLVCDASVSSCIFPSCIKNEEDREEEAKAEVHEDEAVSKTVPRSLLGEVDVAGDDT